MLLFIFPIVSFLLLFLLLPLFARGRGAFFPPFLPTRRRFGARFADDGCRFATDFRLRPVLRSWNSCWRGTLFLPLRLGRPLDFAARGFLSGRLGALYFLTRRRRCGARSGWACAWRTCIHAIRLSVEGSVCRSGFNRSLYLPVLLPIPLSVTLPAGRPAKVLLLLLP